MSSEFRAYFNRCNLEFYILQCIFHAKLLEDKDKLTQKEIEEKVRQLYNRNIESTRLIERLRHLGLMEKSNQTLFLTEKGEHVIKGYYSLVEEIIRRRASCRPGPPARRVARAPTTKDSGVAIVSSKHLSPLINLSAMIVCCSYTFLYVNTL